MWSRYMNHIARGSLEVKLPNLDRCSNSCESSQGATVVKAVREEKESVERRARCAKKKKSRKTLCFFQCVAKCFVALEGRKVGSPERRVRRHLAGWKIKNCTPLWQKAHSQVKMTKASTSASEHFWKLRCWKSVAHSRGTKRVSRSKWQKHLSVGALLEIANLKKCTQMWREAHLIFGSDNGQHQMFGPLLHVQVSFRGRRKGICMLPKVSKAWRFCSRFKSNGSSGMFEEDLQRCISCGRRSTRDIFSVDIQRSRGRVLERGC